jgi:hypothetical protein
MGSLNLVRVECHAHDFFSARYRVAMLLAVAEGRWRVSWNLLVLFRLSLHAGMVLMLSEDCFGLNTVCWPDPKLG